MFNKLKKFFMVTPWESVEKFEVSDKAKDAKRIIRNLQAIDGLEEFLLSPQVNIYRISTFTDSIVTLAYFPDSPTTPEKHVQSIKDYFAGREKDIYSFLIKISKQLDNPKLKARILHDITELVKFFEFHASED